MGDLNLIPADRLSRKRLRARVGAWVGVCGVVTAMMAAAVGSANYCLRGTTGILERELEAVDLSIAQYNSTAAELSKEISKTVQELRIAQATGVQPDWGKLLSLLADELSEEVVLSSCHLIESDAGNAQATDAPVDEADSGRQPKLPGQHYELRLSGLGLSQMATSNFLLRLERMDFFKSVRLLGSNRKAFLDGYAVAFTVVCSI